MLSADLLLGAHIVQANSAIVARGQYGVGRFERYVCHTSSLATIAAEHAMTAFAKFNQLLN